MSPSVPHGVPGPAPPNTRCLSAKLTHSSPSLAVPEVRIAVVASIHAGAGQTATKVVERADAFGHRDVMQREVGLNDRQILRHELRSLPKVPTLLRRVQAPFEAGNRGLH